MPFGFVLFVWVLFPESALERTPSDGGSAGRALLTPFPLCCLALSICCSYGTSKAKCLTPSGGSPGGSGFVGIFILSGMFEECVRMEGLMAPVSWLPPPAQILFHRSQARVKLLGVCSGYTLTPHEVRSRRVLILLWPVYRVTGNYMETEAP